ncbi:dTDP-4-amino-4,6-dideoxygalactose transaminase [Vibrio tetraodonis]|uniref:dTDP-4-amino-4,6-dideoxygalactose transaminase n=1 Tax=Vibrio tetraodonis TaxID=2231647 RepID=UPI000E0A9C4C|nr:dTDP-4-amino-4,6-dideoxygalactose transaminase [Vibrio tetraodonis]
MIDFFKPTYTGDEDQYVLDSMKSQRMSGDGKYSQMCHEWFEDHIGCEKVLLTPSCTHALEMTAILINVQPGDEVIMPSYTFVSTANAFVLRGAKIVFVDIKADDMNIDESLIEEAITDKTVAIVPVHYAGVACEMDTIMDIAERHQLYVIEDAAQGVMSTYKGRPLGSIGHLGAYSFHETKNYTSGGEGGMLIINSPNLVERSEIIREKGTNRNLFFRGMVDKYSWVDIGSSYLMSDIQAAYLWGQLDNIALINDARLAAWDYYYKGLFSLERLGLISLAKHKDKHKHNAHMFYIKVRDVAEREHLISFLKDKGITAVFHYVPLHSSKAGQAFSQFHGIDRFTTRESERLIRLPIFHGITVSEQEYVVESVRDFYGIHFNDRIKSRG